jgi:antitoxin CptB
MSESREIMIKRLRMRSMRRGIKEMDLILMGFADAHLTGLSAAELKLYDQLLSENDHDLYGWIGGMHPTPPAYLDLVTRIAAGAEGVTRPA